MNEWMDEWMNERNEWMNETKRMNERINEWINENEWNKCVNVKNFIPFEKLTYFSLFQLFSSNWEFIEKKF